MLRTRIATEDVETGKELSVPEDLRAKVQRAADILVSMLRKVGEKFDIEARWWFEPRPGNDFAVLLSLTVAQGGKAGICWEFPKRDLTNDESIRQRLWTPIGHLIPTLSEEVDREFESVRRGRQALTTTAEE